MFVIMNVKEEYLHSVNYRRARYKELRYAKSACTRLNKKYGADQYVVLTEEEFTDKYDPIITVYNNITGDGKTPIYIRKSERGGCCDPSSERYHSM